MLSIPWVVVQNVSLKETSSQQRETKIAIKICVLVSVRPKHKSQLLILVLAMQKVLIQPKFLAKILTPDHDDQQCLRPHVEKKICKNFENWLSNRNFCSPYKNSETSQKKSRKGVFSAIFEQTPKKVIVFTFASVLC